MGWMTYDGLTVDFDDRVLAHLQIVIILRFRRSEPLTVSWVDSLHSGNGRSSLWMSPNFPVYFKFLGSRPPAINTAWLERLTASAESSIGLVVTDEHGRPLFGTSHFMNPGDRSARASRVETPPRIAPR